MNRREPLFHMSKRAHITPGKNILIHLIGALLGLIVCAIVIVLLTGQDPFQVYAGIIKGAMGNSRKVWITIRTTMMLLLIAVGLTPAFMMRFWNIGAEGQVLIGASASAALMIYVGDKVPNAVLIVMMIVGAMGAGLIWGLIPAYFKAKYNTNETLFTLMMNYVAIQIVALLVCNWETPKGSNTVGTINSTSRAGYFPKIINNNDCIMIIVIVLLVTVLMYLYLKRSKQGFEIAVVGSSQNTARYAGISVKDVILRTMMISGAICGLTGAIVVGGIDHSISTKSAGGFGFTAIIVAWMAHFNPLVMVVVSGFLIFMQQGASQIATDFKINLNLSNIITGILLFFLIGCEFFVNYRLEFQKKDKEAA